MQEKGAEPEIQGDLSQVGEELMSTWRTCLSSLPLYEYLMQRTKIGAREL